MGTEIIKVKHADDLYVVWSHTTESPHMWGERALVRTWLITSAHLKTEYATPEVDKRLARCDEHGTSAMYPTGDTLIFELRGYLQRDALCPFLDSYDEDTDTFSFPLTPFEDEEYVEQILDR